MLTQFSEQTPPDAVASISNTANCVVVKPDERSREIPRVRSEFDSIMRDTPSKQSSSSSSFSSKLTVTTATVTSRGSLLIPVPSSSFILEDKRKFFDITGDSDSIDCDLTTAPAVSDTPLSKTVSLECLFPIHSFTKSAKPLQPPKIFNSVATATSSIPPPSSSSLPLPTDTRTPNISRLIPQLESKSQSQVDCGDGKSTRFVSEVYRDENEERMSMGMSERNKEDKVINEEQREDDKKKEGEKMKNMVKNKNDSDLRSLASPIEFVCEFVKSVCRQVFPLQTVWGSRHNLSAFLAAVDRYAMYELLQQEHRNL